MHLAARQSNKMDFIPFDGLPAGNSYWIGANMQKNAGKPKVKCKNCEGKGLVKQGDKKMKCQRCGGTGFKS